MASVITDTLPNGRKRYRVAYRDEHGNRKAVRLSGVSKKDAAEIASKVQAVISARISGAPLSNSVAEWLDNLGDELHGKLSAAGLCRPRKAAKLGEFIDGVIGEWETRKDGKKPAERTVINWKAARVKLCRVLGEATPLRDIAPDDAGRWREAMSEAHAPASVAAYVKRAKQFFSEAVERGYLLSSPFAKIVAGSTSNESRKRYIPRETVNFLIESAPDAEWRLMLGLARFAGMRTPSETLRLRWQDIDWAHGMMRVESPKTASSGKPFRDVPIFQELRGYLLEAQEVAPEGAVYCVHRHRQPGYTRDGLLRILKHAGVTPWPRLWHALRASAATDLADRFPSHVAAAWLGHSEEIAKRDYRSVTAEHLAAARGDAGGGAQGGGNGGNAAEAASVSRKKTPVITLDAAFSMAVQDSSKEYGEPGKSRGKTRIHQGGDAGGGVMPKTDLAAVVAAWPHLSDAGRKAVLAIVRRESALTIG